MPIEEVVKAIDFEIERLQQVRQLLTSTTPVTPNGTGTHKKRSMSIEARKRIADAQRKRWAKQRRAA